ncbi:hypothetical protein I6N90_04605 [Paenibacillus sp. GSMTC-2017]|uniref:hypothetical protein n=1 Tax=Paenibacillus sp. GSMTC-2017 TaxID=2794350 RepID=UPI0018D76837|nr:hypothetical protein [Paenibacillus sp. GSMTC-2017]MBH5317089.1 hypothetical protein [Paenibacillus sp. GSMTC-2017]
MRKNILLASLLALTLVAGCSNSYETVDPASKTSTSTNAKAKQSVEELAAAEKLALEHVTVFINGSDEETKKKYVEEKIHADSKAAYQIVTEVLSSNQQFVNPKVIETIEPTDNKKADSLTLIRDDNNKEVIVYILEGKMSWAFSSEDESEALMVAFEEARSEFK